MNEHGPALSHHRSTQSISMVCSFLLSKEIMASPNCRIIWEDGSRNDNGSHWKDRKFVLTFHFEAFKTITFYIWRHSIELTCMLSVDWCSGSVLGEAWTDGRIKCSSSGFRSWRAQRRGHKRTEASEGEYGHVLKQGFSRRSLGDPHFSLLVKKS